MAAPTAHFMVDDVWPAVVEYMEKHPTGGSLHVTLGVSNIHDEHVEFCLRWADQNDDAEGAALALSLLHLSRSQRGRLVQRWWCGD